MTKVRFISEKFIRDNTILSDNADPKIISIAIDEVQELYLHPALGSPLYKDLKTKQTLATLNADEVELIETYVQPMLLAWVVAETTVTLHYRYRNKAVLTQGGDNATPVNLEEIKFLLDKRMNRAEWLTERLTKYLCENNAKFPLYKGAFNSDDIKPRDTNFETGWYLG